MRLRCILGGMLLLLSGCVIPVKIPEKKILGNLRDSPVLFVDLNTMDFIGVEIYSKIGMELNGVEIILSFKDVKNPAFPFEIKIRLDESDTLFKKIGGYFKICENASTAVLPIRIYPRKIAGLMNENILGVVPSLESSSNIEVCVSYAYSLEDRDDIGIAFRYNDMSFLLRLCGSLFGVNLDKARYRGLSVEECLHLWQGKPPHGEVDDAALCYDIYTCIFKNRKYKFDEILADERVTMLYFFKDEEVDTAEWFIDFPSSSYDVSSVKKFDERLPHHVKRWGIVPSKQNRIFIGEEI